MGEERGGGGVAKSTLSGTMPKDLRFFRFLPSTIIGED